MCRVTSDVIDCEGAWEKEEECVDVVRLTKSCVTFLSQSDIQTGLVKYFLSELKIPLTLRHTQTNKSLWLLSSSVKRSLLSHIVLNWQLFPPLSATTGGPLVRKEREKVNAGVIQRAHSQVKLGTSSLFFGKSLAVVIFIPRQTVCGQNEDELVVSPACHQVVVFGKQ